MNPENHPAGPDDVDPTSLEPNHDTEIIPVGQQPDPYAPQPVEPYAAPAAADPYAPHPYAPADPYAAPTAPADPYAAPTAPADPYAAPTAPADPYATAPQAPADPYAAAGYAQTGYPAYGAPYDPYAQYAAASAGGYPSQPGAGGGAGYPGSPYATPAGAAPAPSSNGRGVGRLIAIAALVGLIAGGVGGAGGYALAHVGDNSTGSSSASTTLTQVAGDTSPRADNSVAAVAEKVLPTVVSIQVTGSGGTATGSGSILRADGYILTNNHVIEGAVSGGSIEVSFNDGTTAAGTVVGRNTDYDLAVVKVDRTGLPTITLGDSEDLQVGDTVIAIGSPLGLQGTVTSGIVSALDRPVTAGDESTGSQQSYISAIQTDAPINPGNSGGALVDGSGRLVGVPSAIATPNQGSVGLGFAIPINQAQRIAGEIIDTGTSTTPVIGVTLEQTTDGDGVTLRTVSDGSPAADAGLKAGDVITAVDGVPVSDPTSFIVSLRSKAPGDKVVLTVGTGSDAHDVTVTLGSRTDGA